MNNCQKVLFKEEVVILSLSFLPPRWVDAELMVGNRTVILVHDANLRIEAILL